MSNPWKLTKAQEQVVAGLLANGACSKKVARLLGYKNQSTVDVNMYRARKRMGYENRFDALLAWDRWMRDSRA